MAAMTSELQRPGGDEDGDGEEDEEVQEVQDEERPGAGQLH